MSIMDTFPVVGNVICDFSLVVSTLSPLCNGAASNRSKRQLPAAAAVTTTMTTVTTDGGENTEFEQLFFNPEQEPPRMTSQVLIRVVVLAVIGGISLVANLMTLASIFRMRQRRMSSHSSTLYTILAHMSIADLLVTLFCIVAEALWTYTIAWLADDITCKFVKYAQVFALYLSTFILIVLALDQLLIVRYPLRKETNNAIVKRAVLTAWILSAILSLPQVRQKRKRRTKEL